MWSALAGRTRSLAAAASLAAILGAAPALAQSAWDMPTPYPDNNFHTLNIQKFAADVAEKTGGQLTIKVHPAGSLIKHPEIKNSVRSGVVPIGEFLMSQAQNENPIFGVDSVPFLATDYEQSGKLWEAARPAIEDALGKQGLKVLYTVPWPPQGIYSKQPLAQMSDLKGIKFRAYNNATERVALLAGAVPTQVEAPDLAQAFATGRVDAMITSPSTGANTKAWDYVSHYYDTQAWLPRNIIVVSDKAWRRLDEATQKAVLDAAAEAEARGLEMSKEETEAKTKELADNGMTVEAPSDALKQGFAHIGETMTSEWAKSAGADGAKVLGAYRASNN
ncbi:TRAP transporter substrate-binding protein [Caenispirillum bisanense]|uniref:TRAP transporter substrate-binding protein n=1 Tax=Caenispirillum bisanense TaxID=414052 RepID=UPI0031DC3384